MTTCPKKFVTPDIIELARLTKHADCGIPPVVGGMLNQTASFYVGSEAVRNDLAMWEADRLDRLKQKQSDGR